MQLTQVMGSIGVLNVKPGYYYKALGNFQQVARIFGEIGNESMVAQSYNLSDLILSKITLIVPRKLVVTILSCVNFIQKLTIVSLLKLNFKSK